MKHDCTSTTFTKVMAANRERANVREAAPLALGGSRPKIVAPVGLVVFKTVDAVLYTKASD